MLALAAVPWANKVQPAAMVRLPAKEWPCVPSVKVSVPEDIVTLLGRPLPATPSAFDDHSF